LLGNFLALLGAAGYGINTVYNEYLMKTNESVFVISRLTAAVIVSLPLSLVFEMKMWPSGLFWLVMMAYPLTMGLFYSLQFHFIRHHGAVLFNVSMLATNFYSFLSSFLIF
jgi:drug/metabolite transporter (DMT)-like permease